MILERRSGRTTRLIDYYIQELFIRGETTVMDHHRSESFYTKNVVFKKLLKRLSFEHQIYKEDLIISNNTISIKNKEIISLSSDRIKLLEDIHWARYSLDVASSTRNELVAYEQKARLIPHWIKSLLKKIYKIDL
jgi:hypothetical protein